MVSVLIPYAISNPSTQPVIRTRPKPINPFIISYKPIRCIESQNQKFLSPPAFINKIIKSTGEKPCTNSMVVAPPPFKEKGTGGREKVEGDEMEKGTEERQSGRMEMLGLCGFGYWVQGLRCFPWLALNYHMAQNLNFHPSTLQFVHNTGNLPMVAKPLYGILSDALYIGGARRIPYVSIGVVLQVLSWGPLALIPNVGEALPTLMACVLVSNLGAAITEVAQDALVAEYGQKHKMYLNLDPSIIGMSKVIGQVVLLSLTVMYNRWWKNILMRKLISAVQSLYAASLLLDLVLVQQINLKIGIPNDIFALCFSSLAETIHTFKCIPFVVLIGSVCPAGCEASVTALLASALTLSSIVSGFFGIGLASLLGITSDNYTNLPIGIIAQSLTALIPLLWINNLPNSQPGVAKESNKGRSKHKGRNRRDSWVVFDTIFSYRRQRI